MHCHCEVLFSLIGVGLFRMTGGEGVTRIRNDIKTG